MKTYVVTAALIVAFAIPALAVPVLLCGTEIGGGYAWS
jgi:hypothetical protein